MAELMNDVFGVGVYICFALSYRDCRGSLAVRGVAFVVFRLRKVCSLRPVLDQDLSASQNRLLKALHTFGNTCLRSSCRLLGL